MPSHSLICSECQLVIPEVSFHSWPKQVIHFGLDNNCRGEFEILWSNPQQHFLHSVHAKERAVVWYNPKTGNVAYPGRNDVPMPERYKRYGYERRELTSLRDVERFEKQQTEKGKAVRNEAIWFDKGSGRGFEDGNRYE